jgi:hypothetical protein
MYERFTDRARKVMKLAEKEAMRFNHEYIGTEHVLLGLIKEGSGVAANVLKNLDIDLRKVRREVEKIIQPGPDMVTMGKLPQTPRVKKVIDYAIDEARNLIHNYIGTEHLLLGLLREEEGVAAQVLMNLGVKLPDVRKEVLQILGYEIASEESHSGRVNEDQVLQALGEQNNLKIVNLQEVKPQPEALALVNETMASVYKVLPLSFKDKVLTIAIGDPHNLSVVDDLRNLLNVNEVQALLSTPQAIADALAKAYAGKEENPEGTPEKGRSGPPQGEAPPSVEREQIRSLERQLWNVRVMLGALAGALAGVLLAASQGAVLGLILGGIVAALGRRIPAALAGGISGALLGSAHLPSEGGGLTGALLGALAGILIAEIGSPSDRRGFANLWRRK